MAGIKQISLKIESVSGKLSFLSDVLGQEGVNIRAISVKMDSPDLSVIYIVVDDPKKAIYALKLKGLECETSDVLAVEVPDHPGGLNAVLRPLKDADINVITMYPYIGRASKPIIVMEVDKLDDAARILEKNWVKIWGEEVYRL